MANPKHLKILKQGVKVWNKWREDNPEIQPDISTEGFYEIILDGINFNQANLEDISLVSCYLRNASFEDASLGGAFMNDVDFSYSNFTAAAFHFTDFTFGNFNNAMFAHAFFLNARFHQVGLSATDFTNARLLGCSFSNLDLSKAIGLENIWHHSSSTIGIDTLYESAGKIPLKFLQGCGVPDDFITYIPSIIGAKESIQFYSCFISYSNKDEEFARRLYSRMRDEKLRVWFAPEDMKGGLKFFEQIEQAIQLHDRLLLILSEESMKSNWVIREVRRARKTEREQNRRKLFPISLVPFDAIRDWSCLDTDTGEDIAEEARSYHIPDFSDWKNHDSFEKGFKRLLDDLRAEEKRQAEKRA